MKRSTFRHGDLRRALLDAGLDLAREGGPGAVVLREATRRSGVAPNAAYRHFASHAELLAGVRAGAFSLLAQTMETEIAAAPRHKRAADAARAQLRAVGKGYLKFAFAEPGLFRTAFSTTDAVENDVDKAKTGTSGLNPFQLLTAALDKMAAAGILPPKRRPGAEYLAWSAVHGLALLVIDGPLRGTLGSEIEKIAGRLLEMVEKGL